MLSSDDPHAGFRSAFKQKLCNRPDQGVGAVRALPACHGRAQLAQLVFQRGETRGVTYAALFIFKHNG